MEWVLRIRCVHGVGLEDEVLAAEPATMRGRPGGGAERGRAMRPGTCAVTARRTGVGDVFNICII
eukprot:354137-Chlamydomonas_euryale.AAC.1